MKEKVRCDKSNNLQKSCVFVITCIVFVFLLELFVFNYRRTVKFTGTEIKLYNNQEYSMSTVGYDITNNNQYASSKEDSYIIFDNLNQNVESVLVTFSDRMFKRNSFIQVYYRSGDDGFSEGNSTPKMKIPIGTSRVVLNIPRAEYSGLRVDIDGVFSLNDIQVSDQLIEMERVKDVNINWCRMLVILISIAIITTVISHYISSEKNEYSLKRKEILFCFLCFVFYFAWAVAQPLNYAPDEAMRYDVTQFLFQHNRMPVGDELLSPWGFSYAHSPTMLCNLLGYIFMKIASLFTSSQFLLLISARMVSVCCATSAIYFMIKISKHLFNGPIRWVMVTLVACMPQFCFLASYVNNDMVAFLGVTMILYAWILGINYNWNYRNATLLSVGISISALAYYNSYAWILMSILLFFITYCYKNKGEYKQLRGLTIYIVGLTFVLIAYWFLRHLVLYGDLLGMTTAHKYGELYAIESLKPSNRISLYAQGVSLFEMLGDKYDWLEISYKSFVGNFGYMQYQLGSWVYCVYQIFAFGGLGGLIAGVIKHFHDKSKKLNLSKVTLYVSMMLCVVITVALSIGNSLFADFQAQGRYCYPAFPAIAVFITKGYDTIFGYIEKKEQRYAISSSVVTAIVCIAIYAFSSVYLPT